VSWETAISGYFELNPSLSKEEANNILRELKSLLEVESVELSGGLYYFKSLNFTSHIEPEKLKREFQEYKDKLLSVSLSIWFINEPDCHFEIRKGKVEYETSIF